MQACETLNAAASPVCVSPSRYRLRISKTSASESFRRECFSPRCRKESISDVAPRPFSIMSRTLSRTSPKKRWSGLQHGGLSQRCNTQIPFGTSPKRIAYDTRCAFSVVDDFGKRITPYPLAFAPTQSQQDSVLLIRDQNRSISSCEKDCEYRAIVLLVGFIVNRAARIRLEPDSGRSLYFRHKNE